WRYPKKRRERSMIRPNSRFRTLGGRRASVQGGGELSAIAALLTTSAAVTWRIVLIGVVLRAKMGYATPSRGLVYSTYAAGISRTLGAGLPGKDRYCLRRPPHQLHRVRSGRDEDRSCVAGNWRQTGRSGGLPDAQHSRIVDRTFRGAAGGRSAGRD